VFAERLDAFEKVLFFWQNVAAAFIIHSFTYPVSINGFCFFAILCEVTKLAGTVASFDLV
jgi:hypothetical protein